MVNAFKTIDLKQWDNKARFSIRLKFRFRHRLKYLCSKAFL